MVTFFNLEVTITKMDQFQAASMIRREGTLKEYWDAGMACESEDIVSKARDLITNGARHFYLYPIISFEVV